MKKISLLLASLLLCMLFVTPALAAARLVDSADLLSASSYTALLFKLDGISNEQNFDVVIVTVHSLGGKPPRDYADDYFDYGGYRENGILLLVSMEERDYYISTCGTGQTKFPDAAVNYLKKQVKPTLSNGDYAMSFNMFAEQCDAILRGGKSAYASEGSFPKMALIALIVGLLVAFIMVSVMKGKLKSVAAQRKADAYVRQGSLAVTASNERFLYHTVTRTARQSQSSGSSSHTGSSGRSHGGSGGKF